QAAYGQPASGFAMLGYSAADTLIRALEAAGADLTPESFKAAMENVKYDSELLGTTINYTPETHQGANDVIISVVEGGVWKMVGKQ
ncbi:MAG: branched-chain amino acid ABC transporter substrate-binding protein, partial [Rhodobacteraceae bacterium]|nr:branched-chain amino acid ABC transporter substrate-binding protein [Paracoccaceae bacterium]